MVGRILEELREELQRLIEEQAESLKRQTFGGLSAEELLEQDRRLKRIREVSADFLAALKNNLPYSRATRIVVGCQPELVIVCFLSGRAGIGFNDHFHLCSCFESSLLTFFVGHYIFNANLSIKIVPARDVDLCLLCLAGKGWLYQLLDSAL